MDFSHATNQQLYQIANDESARLIDRYQAAKMLQERKKANELQISAVLTK